MLCRCVGYAAAEHRFALHCVIECFLCAARRSTVTSPSSTGATGIAIHPYKHCLRLSRLVFSCCHGCTALDFSTEAFTVLRLCLSPQTNANFRANRSLHFHLDCVFNFLPSGAHRRRHCVVELQAVRYISSVDTTRYHDFRLFVRLPVTSRYRHADGIALFLGCLSPPHFTLVSFARSAHSGGT